jgi:short-subunit dehydrogenase
MHLNPSHTAVVTGAASGIGLALSTTLLDRGLRVALADVEQDRLAEVAGQLTRAHGDRVLAVPTDVSDLRSVELLHAAVTDRFGAVDLLCNNAGVTGAGGPSWTLDPTDWQWAIEVNIGGVVHGVRAFVPAMVARGSGHVLNVASLSGLITPPFTGPYNATKHAVVALTETLAAELALTGSGVSVSVACPGLVDTAIWQAERNRPVRLQHEPPPPSPAYEAFRAVFDRVAGAPASPDDIAAEILAGVEAGRLHVITHAGLHPHVAERLDTLRAALAV